MEEDKKLEKQNSKDNQPDESTKKATKLAAKAAANSYLGPAGGKAVDALSNTKLGDAILTKGAQLAEKNNPLIKNMSKMADKTGALDVADQAMSSGGGQGGVPGKSGNAPGSSGSAPNSSMNLNGGTSNKKSGGSDFFSNQDKNNSSANVDADGEVSASDLVVELMVNFIKEHWWKILPAILHWGSIVGIILILMFAILGPAETVIEFFRDSWDSMKTLVGVKSEEEWELEYYKKLDEVQEELNKKYGVCVDVNLITATLTVNVANDEYIEEGKEDVEGEAQDGSELGLTGSDYKKMIQQIELLGNMQIKRQFFGLDKAHNRSTGSYCADESITYPFNDEEHDILDFDYSTSIIPNFLSHYFAYQTGLPVRTSLTSRDIASNDLTVSFLKFMTKKANEERNIEYLFYVPAFTIIDKDENGNPISPPIKKCELYIPSATNVLDIGSLNDMDDNVYFWNLMDHFIPDYYKDYVPKISGTPVEGTEAYERIKDIVEDIYLLYHEMGPNQSCEADSYICRDDEGSDYYGGGETSLERSEFIERIAPIAIDEMERTGVLASITIAQAILESGSGSSGLSSKYSNYYGMTAGNCAPPYDPSGYKGRVFSAGSGDNRCTGNAFWNGSVVAMCNSKGVDCQWYRVYDSFKHSTMDHSRLLTNDNYQLNNYSTLDEQLDALVAGGYATDPGYKTKVKKLISDYNLTQYDIGSFDGTIEPITDPQYTDQICIGGSVTGDWANWKQYDPAWKGVPLGPSTVGKIGCAMTSVAIQIARSGVSTTLGANFNPGTFAQELTRIGGFDSRGNIYWSKVSEIAPGFIWTGIRISSSVGPDAINNLVNQGYYIILNVKNGRHWVAVDRVEGNKIYMFDPGSGGTEVGQTYGLSSIVGYTLYKKG